MKSRLFIFYTTLALSFVMTILQSCSKDLKDRHPSLLLYQNSKNISFGVYESVEQLSYNIEMQYPADAFIEWIKNELKAQGWKPLKESFLNPGLPTSITTGWSSYIDGTTIPNENVHQWLADWSNASGDVITYGLRYRYPVKGEKDMRTLYVFGNYEPKEVAQKMLDAAKKNKNL